ncbi:inositol monophosphatase [Micromonospora sp. NBC_01699]|uniref:inositol monophosphatase family protein n=1 Tax=Micromonospora sp. NBC_01699 TaxID=2975984 RepID=UPI002E2B9A15|nr:inositol monophosphatase family protein [Micromonospora sp. NBC_01699]
MIDEVGALLRTTAAEVILPLFGHLGRADVSEKAPGELVTVADRRAERVLGEGLLRLLPGSVVVGEEGVAADPAILAHLHGTVPAWLVDPLDGTANFAAGREPFAVMVALLEAGVIRASWILDPIADRLLTAEAGRGSYLDGVAVRPTVDAPATALRGAVMSRFLPPAWRSSVEAGAHRLGTVLPGQHCAGREYADILTGAQQFALFWRTLPWDHAPGVLLLQEAGGVARRLDGEPYHPADDRDGLLVAADEQTWHTVRETLLPDV